MDVTALLPFVNPTGKSTDPAAYNKLAALFGLEPARGADFAPTVALCQKLIPGCTITADALALVQSITQCGVQIMRENGAVTGMDGFIPLRREGLLACEEGWFDPVRLDDWLIARPDEVPAAIYGWGFVGSTERARKAVVKHAVAVGQTLMWALDSYSRPVTADGDRVVVGKLGYEYLESSETNLAKHKARGRPIEAPATASTSAPGPGPGPGPAMGMGMGMGR